MNGNFCKNHENYPIWMKFLPLAKISVTDLMVVLFFGTVTETICIATGKLAHNNKTEMT